MSAYYAKIIGLRALNNREIKKIKKNKNNVLTYPNKGYIKVVSKQKRRTKMTNQIFSIESDKLNEVIGSINQVELKQFLTKNAEGWDKDEFYSFYGQQFLQQNQSSLFIDEVEVDEDEDEDEDEDSDGKYGLYLRTRYSTKLLNKFETLEDAEKSKLDYLEAVFDEEENCRLVYSTGSLENLFDEIVDCYGVDE